MTIKEASTGVEKGGVKEETMQFRPMCRSNLRKIL